jgi:hypothetical protein
MLCVVMLDDIMLSVILLNVVVLSVVMLNDTIAECHNLARYAECH